MTATLHRAEFPNGYRPPTVCTGNATPPAADGDHD
jgi:hypothetical protein